MENLFVMNNNGELTFNRVALLQHPLVKKIYKRDRGGVIVGDSEGRNKERAKAEVMYAWWIVNTNSPGNQKGLEGNELIKYAKKQVGLPDEWTPDELVEQWVAEYRDMHKDDIVVNTINVIIESLKFVHSMNNTLIKNIREAAKNASATDFATIVDNQNSLMKLVKDVPDTIEKFKQSMIKLYEEEKVKKIAKGGIQVTSSMNPEND